MRGLSITTLRLRVEAKLKIAATIGKGMVGYFAFPDWKDYWGGPFNGQHHRLAIFRELQNAFQPKTIVETGTYRGTTTALFASIPEVRVYTIESHPWSYGYSLARFLFAPRVTVLWGDSRKRICELVVSDLLSSPVFFYLDAHWGDDPPLRTELEIILSACPKAIVMIDDFKVEGDAAYGFDDYGAQRQLCITHIQPVLAKFHPVVLFPSGSGETESGARRGCVVLLNPERIAEANSFSTLRRYDPSNDASTHL
jgi:predicted O-methyltransferase YrrM